MKTPFRKHAAICAVIAGAGTLVALSGSAATWGSIRANNHGFEAGREPQRNSAPQQPAVRNEARAPGGNVISRGREGEQRGGENQWRGGTERHEERGREFEHEHRGEITRAPEVWRHGGERWHEDLDRDRLHSYFWFNYSPGMVIGSLPPDYSQVYVSGNPYYYDQGVYYQPSQSGYVVVPPPVGAIVPALPPGVETIQIGSVSYYYAGGAFYVQTPQGFLVVAPPVGVTVPYLPPGAQLVNINGGVYYRADGAYFLPTMQDGVTVYTTAQP